MKRMTILSTAVILLMFISQTLFAQSQFSVSKKSTSDTLFYIGDDGNVGIGTTEPSVNLDIRGKDIDIGASINLGNSDDSHWLWLYGGRGGASPFGPGLYWQAKQPLRFLTHDGQFNELMRIAGNGFLGLGTIDPQVKLDIQLSNNSAGERAIRALNPNMILNDALFFVLGRSDDMKNMGYMRFKYSGAGSDANRLSFGLYKVDDIINITGLGNVGIGTTSPGSLLEVAGKVHSTLGGFKFPDGSVQTSAAGSGAGNTLDEAYDQGGLGAGRVITADVGAFEVNGDDGVLFSGIFNTGGIPAQGEGVRMMWYPNKGAFRAGRVYLGGSTFWDNDSIGYFSTAFGYNSKAKGDYSFAVGNSTSAIGIRSAAFGSSSIASGNSAMAMGLSTKASGDYSIALGGGSTASGHNSTAIGGSTTASGIYSTAMGWASIASGDYSTAIGRGIEASGDHSFGIALSLQSGTQVTNDNTMAIMGGKVGIGIVNPSTTFEVADTIYASAGGFKFPDGTVQTSAASAGTVSEINDLTDGKTRGSSIYLGSGAGESADGSSLENTGVGNNALYTNTTGSMNTANGYHALRLNTTGHRNTANGAYALNENTEGHSNTANGVSVLTYNTTGYENTANGYQALRNNTTGYENTANGAEALHSNTEGYMNTAIGYEALYDNTSGHWNTANGYEALYRNTGGSNNTANGAEALKNNYWGTLNTANGFKALLGTTNPMSTEFGDKNTAIGAFALYSNAEGDENTANGFEALYKNTSGGHNTANGTGALYYNTWGSSNTANGSSAIKSNTSGGHNTANGASALFYNRTGSYNVGLGSGAIFFNQEGSQNTIIGYQAGRGTATHDKSGNVFLGYQAGYSEHGNNKLYIENSNSSTPLIGGDFSLDEIYLSGNVGIGTTTPSEMLEVADTIYSTVGGFKFPDGTVQITAGDGGVHEINDLSDGITDGNSVFLGSGAGVNDDGSDNRNTAVGISALNTNTTGSNNTANGYYALYSNTTGNYNTANGYYALHSNTTGYGNTANGYSALYFNTTGENNIANGLSALYSNTTGSMNTANGAEALTSNTIGNFNTANGYYALHSNTTGIQNVGFGMQTNRYNQEGSQNTIIGYQAGRGTALHNKSGNVFLGYQAGYNEIGSNLLYIENSNSTLPLIWGDFNADSVRIHGDLHVTGDIHIDGTGSGVSSIDDLSDGKSDGNSVFLGSGAGVNYNGGGKYNTAVGINALYFNQTGVANTANGYDALQSNTSGSYNVGLGSFANLQNQGGSQNTIIGYNAGRGTALHNKSGNVFLGYQAGYSETGDNKLYIENSNSSTPLIGGDFATDEIYINGNVGISEDSPTAELHVGGTDGVLFTGTYDSGTIPVEGTGARMMWYPAKAAFRAGHVSSTQWDDANIGDYSIALGYSTTASNLYSTAMGASSTASGHASTAIGRSADATGTGSVAIGDYTEANGSGSTALGRSTTAGANYSSAMGSYVNTSGIGSFAIGDYSTTTIPTFSTGNRFYARFANGYRLYTNSSLGTGVYLNAGGASWSSISDSTKKENFKPSNGEAVLSKIGKFNLGTWNYKGQEPSKFRHYGPMAQDFYAAFGHDGIGTIGCDTLLSSADFDGINFIAIQALEKRTSVNKESIEEIESLRSEVTSLMMENLELKEKVVKMENEVEEFRSLVVEYLEKKESKVEKTVTSY